MTMEPVPDPSPAPAPAPASPASQPAKPIAHARVASRTPGRLRVRVRHPHQHPELLHRVQQRLESRVGRGAVHVNPRTGSVLVHYDRHTSSHDDILGVLHDVGLLFDQTAEGLDMDAPEVAAGHSKTSGSIVNTMTDLDRRIALATGHQVDLKVLFPLALGGLGVWQLASRGFGFTEVPAYVLLWYAFDSFWKFHGTPADADADQADAQGQAQVTSSRRGGRETGTRA